MKRFHLAVFGVFFWVNNVSPTVKGEELVLTETEESIRITQGVNPVLEYVKISRPVPHGLEPHFRRSGYIHPVYTPTGQELTGDYPADHAHQHAVFFAWTKSSYNGQDTDFWNQAKRLGRIEFRKVVDISREEGRVSFTAKHAFQVNTKTESGDALIDVLYEFWTVTVHKTPNDHFLFDIVSVQECATTKPLNLAKFHYGGMGFRGIDEWLTESKDRSITPGGLQFLTSEGKDRWAGNHTRPDWVAFSGRIGTKDVSAAVFCSPGNFRAPQPVRIHPNKPYFCFAPMVEGPFRISPGEKYVSSYRYLVTSKPVDENMIRQHWNRYAKVEEQSND